MKRNEIELGIALYFISSVDEPICGSF
eukprot:COSAG02_NODE_41000_length_399_cov_0.840000_1_plen_26_part_10